MTGETLTPRPCVGTELRVPTLEPMIMSSSKSSALSEEAYQVVSFVPMSNTQALAPAANHRSASGVELRSFWMTRNHGIPLGGVVYTLGSSNGTMPLVPLQVGVVLLPQINLVFGKQRAWRYSRNYS